MEQITYLDIKDLKPYKGNPRKIPTEAVDAVASSIKEFGFRSPIVIDKDNTIINGHTRFKAAKKLKLKSVPCIRVEDLSEEQIKKFRLIDNKSAEFSSWDADLLADELFNLDLNLDFDFDFTEDLKKRKKWDKDKIRCNLKDALGLKRCNDTIYHSLFRTGKEGRTLEELKVEENVKFFAKTASECILSILGSNIESNTDWCLITTPRRRHREGFHFATDVCYVIADTLTIPFYNDAIESENVTRMDPIFNLKADIPEQNVIIYDDILTTGYTLQATKQLLVEEGHIVLPIISIDNH